jgi:hypothetical protein
MDKLRAKWGVKKDVHQDMVDMKARELLSADDGEEDLLQEQVRLIRPEDPSQGFDLSSLNALQLHQLQEALAARMSAQPMGEPDEEDDDFDDDDD